MKAPIVERVLTRISKGRRVHVKIWAPARDGRDWRCRFQITGIGDDSVRSIGGVDSVQALQLALHGVAHYLKPHRRSLKWLFDAGDLGFTAPIPSGYGEAFIERFERAMERASLKALRSSIPKRRKQRLTRSKRK